VGNLAHNPVQITYRCPTLCDVAVLLGVLFFFVPLIEIFVILKISVVLGPVPTLACLVLLSAAGAWLVKREGLDSFRRIQTGLRQGRMPTVDVVDGFLVLLAGALLLTPGFVTSVLGLMLALPPIRAFTGERVADMIRKRVSKRIRDVGSRLADDPIAQANGSAMGDHARTGPMGNGSAQANGAGTQQGERAYRRPGEPNPDDAKVWGARVRDHDEADLDVIDVDGEEIVFGQGELGPTIAD
jgi:UPF0716 protein FxsA